MLWRDYVSRPRKNVMWTGLYKYGLNGPIERECEWANIMDWCKELWLKTKCHKILWQQNQRYIFVTPTSKRHKTWFKVHGFWRKLFRQPGVINVNLWYKLQILWHQQNDINQHISCSDCILSYVVWLCF